MTLLTNFFWGFDGSRQEMLIQDGRVVLRGPATGAVPDGAEILDLGGKTLYPAFNDAHCHFLPTGLDLLKLNLGNCETRESVLDAVRDWETVMEPGKWLYAVHYDQTRFPDGRHLTRHDLDAVSSERPILLRHVSGHAGVANSAALAAAGIGPDADDPSGGAFERDADGAPNGVLLETALDRVASRSPEPTCDEMIEAMLRAGDRMASLGIACASDMLTGGYGIEKELAAYEEAVRRGCKVRLRLYAIWSQVFGKRGIGAEQLRERVADWDEDRLRIGGIKIFSDGAVGAGTAAIYGSYAAESPSPNPLPSHSRSAIAMEGGAGVPDSQPSATLEPIGRDTEVPLSGEREVSGQIIYAPERLSEMVRTAHDAGFRVAVHSIGDYATDLVMDAFEATGEPSRHRIEHAMLLSDAQIERLARLNCHVTMQPEFLMRFGHAYKRQLGRERAATIKRFRSVSDAGLTLSLNSDRPIVSGDPWAGVEAASDRPEGFDPSENLTREEAIRAYTQGGAAANAESDRMGSLTPGQLADWNVVDAQADNPH